MEIRRVLVTGGAGYLGSFVVRALIDAHWESIVLDNFCTGHAGSLPPEVTVIRADIRARDLWNQLGELDVQAVVHLAARAVVGESDTLRRLYYETNALGTANLLRWMDAYQCRVLVFSSSASVYGNVPTADPVSEDSPLAPISAYGESKVAAETLIHNWVKTGSRRAIILRIFNLAGASLDGNLGEDHCPETHLIPLAVQAVAGARSDAKPFRLFGGDYETRDGFPIRDYIHPEDAARAIVLSLLKLRDAGEDSLTVLNIGSGSGFTSLEVVKTLERVAGKPVPFERAPRRRGDPAFLVADIRAARNHLGWAPTFSLEHILETALRWAQAHPTGYGDGPADAAPSNL